MSYDLSELLQDMAENNVRLNEEIYGYLCTTDTVRLSRWLLRLERVRSIEVKGNSKKAKADRGRKSLLVGKIFEIIVRVLLDGCTAIRHDGNIRSTISEIDFRILIEPSASCIPMFRENGTHAIGEAKCVSTGLKNEWFNELSGILQTHGASLAFLFTSSSPKKLMATHRQCLSLICAAGEQRIIPFGLTQIRRIVDGENFLSLLCEQYVRVTTHSSDLSI